MMLNMGLKGLLGLQRVKLGHNAAEAYCNINSALMEFFVASRYFVLEIRVYVYISLEIEPDDRYKEVIRNYRSKGSFQSNTL